MFARLGVQRFSPSKPLQRRRYSYQIDNVSGLKPSTSPAPPALACPRCDAPLTFWRNRSPRIDSCGFESYGLECRECGGRLAGIVDPADETLLLSEVSG